MERRGAVQSMVGGIAGSAFASDWRLPAPSKEG
jgi:hypothetical protein